MLNYKHTKEMETDKITEIKPVIIFIMRCHNNFSRGAEVAVALA